MVDKNGVVWYNITRVGNVSDRYLIYAEVSKWS